MHLLPCSHCDAQIPVSPSQAGDRTLCPQCQREVAIPKLGQLRQLPRAEASESPKQDELVTDAAEISFVRRGGFLVLGLIATASLVVAGFCGIRWVLIEVPGNSQDHVEMLREQYAEASAAMLIREYEDMEEFGIELGTPFKYKVIQSEKDAWGRSAAIAAGLAVFSVLGATILSVTGRRKPA